MQKGINILCQACLVYLLMSIAPLTAAPAAVALLNACEESLANGFQGIEGDMCIWYVTPCNCDYGRAAELPAVCLPESADNETLALAVVQGLKQQPELQAEDADFAAALILSRIYPCTQSL